MTTTISDTADNLSDWHFHVYFDQSTRKTAEEVVEAAARRFDISVGHFHDRPVGLHPTGSCQLTVPSHVFGPLMTWMTFNRRGLPLFCHADTGDVMKDHTDHTIWLGSMPALNLDVLERFLQQRQTQG